MSFVSITEGLDPSACQPRIVVLDILSNSTHIEMLHHVWFGSSWFIMLEIVRVQIWLFFFYF
jgi:hypothetical protein